MNIRRLIAGSTFLILAAVLYSYGFGQLNYLLEGEYLTRISIYPAGFFTLLGLMLIANELIRDIRTKNIENYSE